MSSKGYVTRITAKTGSSESTDVSGEIASATNTTLKVGNKTYNVDDTSSVTVNVNDGSEKIRTYKALREAVEDGKIISADIVIKKGSVSSVTGDVEAIENAVIYGIDTEMEEITLKLDSGRYTYDMRTSTQATIDNESISITKLAGRAEDETVYADVKVRYERVTEITARTRK